MLNVFQTDIPYQDENLRSQAALEHQTAAKYVLNLTLELLYRIYPRL